MSKTKHPRGAAPSAADTTANKRPRGRPFQPGQSGNPKGRPKGGPHKLKELGVELGITTKRVHQIEQKAINKLQAHLNRVKAALDEGLSVREAAAKLSLPQEAVERLRQLVDWRFSEETRYTLTDKALAVLAYRGKGNVA